MTDKGHHLGSRSALERAAVAGAVGGGLGVLLWLVVVAVVRSYVSGAICQQVIPVTTVERAAEHLVPSSASAFPAAP